MKHKYMALLQTKTTFFFCEKDFNAKFSHVPD